MKLRKQDVLLYAVTDRNCLKVKSLVQAVEQAIQNGATFVQLREKSTSPEEVEKLAIQIKTVTDKYGIPFVIDDNVELARKIGADGVHIGQDDMPLKQARSILGEDSIIGVTCRSVEQALEAEKNGANYIGIGALFATGTKNDTVPMSKETAVAITSAVNIPVVGIAGINHSNVSRLKGYGLDGIAVVSAIFGAENPGRATAELLEFIKENDIVK